MQQAPDDCAKRRLTERIDIITAVDFLHARGYADDDVPPQLARYYYVDIDLLNDVLRTKRPNHMGTSASRARPRAAA